MEDYCLYKKLKYYKDAFDLFNFNTINYSKAGLDIPKISAYCMEGLLGSDFENIEDFIIQSEECINEILDNENNNYNCYLFIKLNINNSSRIDNYMKVWKKLKKTYDVEYMELGPELLLENSKKYYYVSIGKFGLKDMNKALFIQLNNLSNVFMFISHRKDIPSKNEIEKIFNLSSSNQLPNILPLTEDINYYMLFSEICKNGDYIIRLSTSSEEWEIEVFHTNISNDNKIN